jgi:hypothetical protein
MGVVMSMSIPKTDASDLDLLHKMVLFVSMQPTNGANRGKGIKKRFLLGWDGG